LFCSKCGKEIEDDAEFCKHCGAKIGAEGEIPDSQVESSEETKEPEAKEEPVKTIEEEPMEPKPPLEEKKSRRGLAALLIIIGLIIASLSIWYIVAYESVDEYKYYTYAPETAPSSLTLEVEMNGGATDIGFTSDSSDPVVYIDHHEKWDGPVVSQPSFSTSSSKVKFDAGTVWGESDSELAITLRSDVKYSIDIKTSNGALSFNSDIPGASFGTFTIDTLNGASNLFISHATISGKIWVTTENGASNIVLSNSTVQDIDSTAKSGASNIRLKNCTVRNIKSRTHSGGLIVTSRDLRVTSDTTWDLKVTKGGILLDINQSKSLGADLTVNAKTEIWRDIDAFFEGNSTNVRAKYTASTSSGEVLLLNGEGFEDPVSGTMESSNYGNDALDQFFIRLTTDDGDIDVDAVNS
jgi:hypothetical protein